MKIEFDNFRNAVLKVGIILVPCWSVAWVTQKMVYVVPTVAAAVLLASAVSLKADKRAGRVDEDAGSIGKENESDGASQDFEAGETSSYEFDPAD